MTELASPIGRSLTSPESDVSESGVSELRRDGSAEMERDALARARLRALVDEHFDFVWRSVRRLGVPLASVDDATQQVFWTACRKLDAIVPGREKSFLFGVAARIASDARRVARRRLEREAPGSGEVEVFSHPDPLADELLDRKRMRAYLDEFLDELSIEVRTAFVLYEAEGMTVPEIADFIDAPEGTIASRLRLARKRLDVLVERLRSTGPRGGEK